jgi:hypothetical protein
VGQLTLAPPGVVVLRLAGDRKPPHPDVLANARARPARYATARPAIAAALLERLESYRDAADLDDARTDLDRSAIDAPDDVWPHVAVGHAVPGYCGTGPMPRLSSP